MKPGTVISERYEIVRLLGSGGMGEVYEAVDLTLGRRVTIKTNAPGLSPGLRQRFEREARAVAALAHPNILQIFDYRADRHLVYFVAEFLEGETLRERLLIDKKLHSQQVLAIADQVCLALVAAHDNGIVHRDIKPANIFLCKSGVAKLLDFGLAGWAFGASGIDIIGGLTSPGAICGTLGYLSPEQAKMERAEPRSDIFSLGCVLFEMLTGRVPFDGMTALQSLQATICSEAPLICEFAPNTPLWLDRLVRQCLMKMPQDRPRSVRVLREAIATYRSGTATHHPLTSRASKGAVHIVVVDANPLVLKLVRALGSRAGYTVTTASSWIEFNHVAAGTDFDLIMLDENLPAISGSRLAQNLRSDRRFDNVPIILFSHVPEKELRVPLRESGADLFVLKPWTAAKLTEVIDHFFPRRLSDASALPQSHLLVDTEAPTPRML